MSELFKIFRAAYTLYDLPFRLLALFLLALSRSHYLRSRANKQQFYIDVKDEPVVMLFRYVLNTLFWSQVFSVFYAIYYY